MITYDLLEAVAAVLDVALVNVPAWVPDSEAEHLAVQANLSLRPLPSPALSLAAEEALVVLWEEALQEDQEEKHIPDVPWLALTITASPLRLMLPCF